MQKVTYGVRSIILRAPTNHFSMHNVELYQKSLALDNMKIPVVMSRQLSLLKYLNFALTFMKVKILFIQLHSFSILE